MDPEKISAPTIVMRGEFDGIAGFDDLALAGEDDAAQRIREHDEQVLRAQAPSAFELTIGGRKFHSTKFPLQDESGQRFIGSVTSVPPAAIASRLCVAASMIIVATVWRNLFDDQYGAINQVLASQRLSRAIHGALKAEPDDSLAVVRMVSAVEAAYRDIRRLSDRMLHLRNAWETRDPAHDVRTDHSDDVYDASFDVDGVTTRPIADDRVAMLPADRIIAAQHAWLSPLPPEGASAIVHRDLDHAPDMARAQGVRSLDMRAAGIVDRIVVEKPDAADEAEEFCARLGEVLRYELATLLHRDRSTLVAERTSRFRGLGIGGDVGVGIAVRASDGLARGGAPVC